MQKDVRIAVLVSILLITVAVLVGCESFKNYQACMADVDCKQVTENVGRQVDHIVVDSTGLVVNATTASLAAGSIIGGIVSFFVGVSKGKKIRKGR